MGVCKFFLEGYCKFGDRCSYEHVDQSYQAYDRRISNHDRPSGTSVLKSSSISSSDQNQQYNPHLYRSSQPSIPHGSSRYNIYELMQLVSKDIMIAEKSNQWPLSCYSPLRDLINLPGLLDYSPDELRWEYYLANQNGRLPVCQAIVQQLFANVAKINNNLKKKDTAYSIIEGWLHESEMRVKSQVAVVSGGNNDFASTSVAMNTQSPDTSSFTFALDQLQPPSNQLVSPMQQTISYQSGGFHPQPVTSSVFGGSQMKATPQIDVVDKSVYSRVEELSQSELDAFRADKFVFGHIPTKPPPAELCG